MPLGIAIADVSFDVVVLAARVTHWVMCATAGVRGFGHSATMAADHRRWPRPYEAKASP